MTIEQYLDSIELEAKEGNGPFWKGVRFVIKELRAFLEREKPELTLREVKECCNKQKRDCENCSLYSECCNTFGEMDIEDMQRRVRG